MKYSIKRNYLYNVLYQILSIITPLLTAPYLARVLGAEKIGIYSYLYSITSYFMMTAMLGVNNYGNRTCAMVRDDKRTLSKTFSEIYLLQLLTTVACVFVYVGRLIIFPIENRAVATIMIVFIISAGIEINWFFFGVEEFRLTTSRNIIIKLIITICIFVFVRSKDDLTHYTFIMAFGALLNQLYMWPYLRKYIFFVRPSLGSVLKHVKPNLILFIPVVAVSLYKMMDKVMLGNMSTMVETGYYENAEKLINIPLGFINALGVIMLPRMSNLTANKEVEKSKKMMDASFLFVSFLSIAMSFGVMSIANEFVVLFFGSEFIPAIKLVKWIAPTMIFFSFANVIRTQYLLPNKHDKSYIISVFTGAGINLLINALLIPKYNAFGAVIGTLVAEASVCIMQLIFVRRELPLMKYIKQAFPFLVMGIIMFASVRAVSGIFENLFFAVGLELVTGVIVYCVLSYVYLKLYNPTFKNIELS